MSEQADRLQEGLLVLRCQTGDDAAYAELIERYGRLGSSIVSTGRNLDQPNTPFLMLAKLTAVSIVLGSLSFIVLVGAGLSTVLLVFRSRRATLRQINANLLRISEQLKAAGP